MFGLSYLKLGGIVGGAIAVVIFVTLALHWKHQAADRGEKLAAICQTTRAASDKPKLACGEVAVEIQHLGNALRDVKTKTAQAQAADAQHARAVEARQNRTSEESSHDYQAELARVRADYAELVRRNAAARGADQGRGGNPPVSGSSAAAAGPGATAAQDRLPPADALIATEQALQLQAILEWGKKVGVVKP